MKLIGSIKFAEDFKAALVSGDGSFFFRSETPDMPLFSVVFDVRFPKTPRAIKTNTLVFGAFSCFCGRSLIRHVLRLVAKTKIGASIIKRIAVDMVNVLTRLCTHNSSMHQFRTHNLLPVSSGGGRDVFLFKPPTHIAHAGHVPTKLQKFGIIKEHPKALPLLVDNSYFHNHFIYQNWRTARAN